MAVVAANYTSALTALRRCLAAGTELTGAEKRLLIDILEESTAASTALEALLVTAFAAWNSAGASDSSAVYTAQLAACAAARTAAIVGTAVTANDKLDGRAS